MSMCLINVSAGGVLCMPYLYAAFMPADAMPDIVERRYFQKIGLSTNRRMNFINPWWCQICLNLSQIPSEGSVYSVFVAFSAKPLSRAYLRETTVQVKNAIDYAVLGLQFIEAAEVTIDGIRLSGKITW
jgi:hypothetical protein